MRPTLLILLLLFTTLLFGQNTADGIFLNPASIVQQPSIFGPQDVNIFACDQDIIFDGDASAGEDAYFLEVTEFDLATWTVTNSLFSGWICTSCTAPNNIDVRNYFGGTSPQCDKVYKFRLATGPVFTTIDRFFQIDCGNAPPSNKTFDVFHRLQQDLTTDIFDLGAEAIIDANGDYASIGYSQPIGSANIEFAVARYDQSGNLSSPARMGVLQTVDFAEIFAAEAVSTSGGAPDGYLILADHDDSGGADLTYVDAAGNMIWSDIIELTNSNVTYNIQPRDMLIHGDYAVITGEVTITAGDIQPFVLRYNYRTRSAGCAQIYRISLGVPTNGIPYVIANNTTASHYTIAGRSGDDLFYFEVEYNCNFALANPAILHPVDGDPGTQAYPSAISFDATFNTPIISGHLVDASGGPAANRLFVITPTPNLQSIILDTGNDEVILTDALLNQQDELILAGNYRINGRPLAFLAAVDPYSFSTPGFLWAKTYSDAQYPETNINDLELAPDGGYFTVGHAIQVNETSGGFDFDFEFMDHWILKTDEQGELNNCQCFEPQSWSETNFGSFSSFSILQSPLFQSISNYPYADADLQDENYLCDQYCPPPPVDDCQVAATATPTADTTDLCCYDLSFFIDPIHTDEFTEIHIQPVGSSQLTPLTSLPTQYSFIQNSNSLISLISNTGNLCPGTVDRYFPTGNLPSVEVCVTDFTGADPMIEAAFIKCDGETCLDTLTLDCNPCIEIINDSTYCEGNQVKYTFDFQNTWDRPITRLVFNGIAPAQVAATPDTLFFPAPGIPVGGYAGPQTICLDNVSYPDTAKFTFTALGIDDCCLCTSDLVCAPIPFCCDTCESIEYVVRDTIIDDNECCYSLDIYHCTDSLFTALRVSTLGSVTLSQQAAGTNWSMQIPSLSSNSSQTFFPQPTPIHNTPIPAGWSYGKINFCIGNINTPADVPQTVTLEWLAGSDTNVVCQDTLVFECQPPGPDTNCVALADTLWDCLQPGVYQLDLDLEIKRPGTTYAAWVSQLHSRPSGASITANPTVLTGTWNQGAIVSMPPISVTNVSPGDSICFVLALSDTIYQGQNIQECCYSDTICLIVPPCDTLLTGYDCDTLELPVYNHDLMGWAAVTCFSGYQSPGDAFTPIDQQGYTVGLIDVRNTTAAPRGPNWNTAMQHFPAFRASSIGQVFGLSNDEDGCLYVASTTLYEDPNNPSFQWGPAGPGGVYKLCPDASGTYQVSAQASLPNVSSGLGQVSYDARHQQVFVANYHDGLIYRLDAASLSTLGTYNPPNIASVPVSLAPDFVPLGRRPLAVAYNVFENRLYYSIWGEDNRNRVNPAATNPVWSVPLDPAGVPITSGAVAEFELPGEIEFTSGMTIKTMPITDLAFSKQGTVLVSERSTYQDVGYTGFGSGHDARVMTLQGSTGTWGNPKQYYLSSSFFSGQDGAGGVDFGVLDNEGCDNMIWASADYMGAPFLFMYGITGLPISGNTLNPSDPNYVSNTSINVDFDGIVMGSAGSAKTKVGDVEIFRDPCCSPVDTLGCCLDQPGFHNAVQNGFVITTSGSTTTVDNPLLDSCHTLQIDWGDGSPFTTVNGANLPVSHTYVGSGPFELCILVTEGMDDGTLCWEDIFCTTVDPIPGPGGCTVCPDTLEWFTLNNSPSNAYFELHTYNGELYIGNYFGTVNGVGRYNGSNWVHLPATGFSGDFERFFEHQGDLWAVVALRSGPSVVGYDLARWDTGTSDWIAQGLNLTISSFYGRINAATSYGNQIVIGGNFDLINGSIPAGNVAAWDPNLNTWNTLNGGFNEAVNGLTVYNGDLIAGGAFLTPFRMIARWDGLNWNSLAGGLQEHASMNVVHRRVNAFYEHNGLLYVGGRFNNAIQGGAVAGTKGMATWDGSNWASIGGGITSTYQFHQANDFKVAGNDLYVAGYFAGVGGQSITGLSRYDGTTFHDTGLGVQLEVYQAACLPDDNGYCEIWIGAEQLFAKLACQPDCEDFDNLVQGQDFEVFLNFGNLLILPPDGLTAADWFNVDIDNDNVYEVSFQPGDSPVNYPLTSYSSLRLEAFRVIGGDTCQSTFLLTNNTQPVAKDLKLAIYPNPGRDQLQLNLDTYTTGPVEVQVYDLTGRLVIQQAFTLISGPNKLAIPADQLAAGSYLVRIRGEQFVASGKWTKVR